MPPSRSPCSCSGWNGCGPRMLPPPSKRPCDRACATSRWPGRLEIIRQDPLTIIDVGHTPDGIRQSLASLQAIYGARGWILVAGVSFDKKVDEIVGALAPSFDTIIATKAHHKGGDAEISPPRRAGSIRRPTFTSPQPSRTPSALARRWPVTQPENLCGRRIVHSRSNTPRCPRRPRAGSEFFLSEQPAKSGPVNRSLTIPERWFRKAGRIA